MSESYIRAWKRAVRDSVKRTLRNHAFYSAHPRFSSGAVQTARNLHEQRKREFRERLQAAQREHPLTLPANAHPVRITPDQEVSMTGDDMGRVFLYQNRIMRGIYPESAAIFREVYESGILPVLAEYHLIPEVRLTDYVTDEFVFVLEVQQVTIQKNTVWSYAMVKDACLLILFLKEVLNEAGFTLIDGHLNNVTFHNGNPMFFDIGSIVPMKENGILTELVFAGISRLVFGFIGNSMMYRLPSHDDDNANIYVFPRCYNLLAREYQSAFNVLKRYYLARLDFAGFVTAQKVLDLHICSVPDIEGLFPVIRTAEDHAPVKDWSEVVTHLSGLEDVHSAAVCGGTFGEAEAELLRQNSALTICSMDYIEHRLDLAYLHLKQFQLDSRCFLYNYAYLQNPQINEVRSDLVLCIDPLNDQAAIYPLNPNLRANAICQIAERYVSILYPSEKEADYQAFCAGPLKPYACLKESVALKNSGFSLMILQICSA